MDAAARAVADPTRRTILRLVHDEERTVTDIAAHFSVSRP
ncbi:MAG: helix-turn-helix domain-containing protein, partial [Acidimicrobiia bacterium]|nr:helix-turn-helix domain-containing protein [Acidimicrobiia bacterium]